MFEDASINKKYLEILVSKRSDGYSKGNKLRFERFLPLVDTAVEQATMYCEDSESSELSIEKGKELATQKST